MEEEYDPTQHTLTVEQITLLNQAAERFLASGVTESDLVIYVQCDKNGAVLRCELKLRVALKLAS